MNASLILHRPIFNGNHDLPPTPALAIPPVELPRETVGDSQEHEKPEPIAHYKTTLAYQLSHVQWLNLQSAS
jgi:hypothetical protein